MTNRVIILNDDYEPENEFIIEEFSGELMELCQRTQNLLSIKQAREIDPGDWIVIVDGDVVSHGDYHPSHVAINMNCQVDILNRRYSADDELLIEQYSGEMEDLTGRVQELLTVSEALSLEQGEWITVIDGEVVETGYNHPFCVRATDD